MQTILVSDCKKLLVKVYVIGYPECGESIIMLFIDGNNDTVVYSVVIDSYKLNDGTFKTKDILVSNNVSYVNLLCWTHPDMDHTKGIDNIVANYCNKNSSIWIPIYMNGLDTDPITYNGNDKKIIKNLFSNNNRLNKCVKPVSACRNQIGNIHKITFSDSLNRNLLAEFNVLSPMSDYLVEKIIRNKTIGKNDLSICIMVKVGPYKFDFCSDIEDITINYMAGEVFEYPLFLKIPHHSSMSSKSFFDKLNNDSQSVGCTTTYLSQGLPHREIIERYKTKYMHLHSTGFGQQNSCCNYGIIEYYCDLFEKREIRIRCHGNAYKL